MPKIVLEFRGFKKRPVKVVIEVSDGLNVKDLRKLWDVEQTLNGLPGVKTRTHVNVEE